MLSHPEYPLNPEEEDALNICLSRLVNGKLRDKVNVPVGISEEKAKETALASEPVQKYLAGKQPRKVIYVPGRLVNIVA